MKTLKTIGNWLSGIGKISAGGLLCLKGSFELGIAMIVSGIGTITGQIVNDTKKMPPVE